MLDSLRDESEIGKMPDNDTYVYQFISEMKTKKVEFSSCFRPNARNWLS